ncbi:MAG: amino acid adenylation domain-containing protein, partial [Myxococcales bacterium]|nr:amino acid adenylation domain-containing protein [Myxococcales bacterium]
MIVADVTGAASNDALPSWFPSAGQQRLYFIHQLATAKEVYNCHFELVFEGALEEARLESALSRVLERHRGLRSVFHEDGTALRVRLLPVSAVAVSRLDLSMYPDGERDAALRQASIEQARTQFALDRGPLLKFCLVRCTPRSHVLLATVHHIVFDASSFSVFFQELAESYASDLNGRAPTLHALPMQVGDYAARERSWLTGPEAQASRDYWRSKLDGLPRLRLPTRRVLGTADGAYDQSSYAGAVVRRVLEPGLVTALSELARVESVSRFDALLSVFVALLGRYSGQLDFGVGISVSLRSDRQLRRLIGFFVNTIVLRCDLDGDPSFAQLLARIFAIKFEALLRHSQLPTEEAISVLGEQRSGGLRSLLNVNFVKADPPPVDATFPGLRVTPRFHVEGGAVEGTAKFELGMLIGDLEDGSVAVTVEYNTSLFDAETAERFVDRYVALVAAVVRAPELPLTKLGVLGDAEERALRARGTARRPGPSGDETLLDRFAASVRAHGDRVAVRCGDDTLTYTALDVRANQLAHRLRALGVGPERRVALCLERSVELVVAVLAVLKAGGAYVPLDADHPGRRVASILADAGASVLVTTSALRDRLELLAPREVLLDVECDALAALPEEPPRLSSLSPDNLAYVIFTSGSTGRPKGVAVPHSNVLRLFSTTRERFAFGPADVWCLFHSIAFDFSVWELWGALLHGGRLVIVPYVVSREPEAFYRLLVEEGVTVLNQTPSAFSLLREVERGRERDAWSVRVIVFGGEALTLPELASWFDRHADDRPTLVNMYGITETTVHVTYRAIAERDSRQPRSLIGAQLDDLELYVLDQHGALVPVGVPGELYVGGPGLARGYLDRPSLTAERFVPNPIGPPGSRLYRTGDQARLLTGGDLEFLGRIDDQIQIRGFRVELGEVEAALRRIPGITQCVVLSEGQGIELRLLAYVVSGAGPRPVSTELRAQLRAQLPDYMIPSAVVVLDAMPLTSQGKLDRRALPRPAPTRCDERVRAPAAPTTSAQALLVEIWRDVLGQAQVGVDDSFFDLGGDSIRALSVLARVRASPLGGRGRSSFSLKQLFERQTIRALTQLEGARDESVSRTAAFALLDEREREWLPAGIEDAYPLSRLQAGMLYHSELSPERGVYHDVFSFHVGGVLQPAVLQQALTELVAGHPLLRTSFEYGGPLQPLQLVHAEVQVALGVDVIDELAALEQDAVIERWIAEERVRPFDIRSAPLLRVRLFRRSPGSFELGLSFHHAILDGWSVATLVCGLLERYAAHLSGEPPPRIERGVAYSEFIAAELRSLESTEDRAFWIESMAGAPLTQLPRPRRREAEAAPGRVRLRLAHGPALAELARRVGVPSKTLVLCAHLRALSLVSGSEEVVAGYVTNNRPELDGADATLGLFLNTVPLRVHLADESWAALARRVFEAELASLEHRAFPMAEVQQALGGAPLFEVAFNYIHFHVYERLAALHGFQLRGQNVFEKTDLALNVHCHVDALSANIELILEYDERSLDRAQVERLAGYHDAALAAMIAAPDARHRACDLRSADEREQLTGWSRGPRAAASEVAVHEQFFSQADRTPERIAVLDQGRALTYAELKSRVQHVARGLRARGVRGERCVGICGPNSVDFVIAMLAVLSAGGAYVPLDLGYPRSRLESMAHDSAIELLLVTGGASLELDGVDSVDLDALAASPREADDVAASVAPGNLAYVIYTSGSTGRPKGVAVTHAGLGNYAQFAREAYADGLTGFVPSQLSPSFDASITTLLVPLLCGGTVQCLRELRGPETFADEGATPGVEAALLKLTPSHLATLPKGTFDRLGRLTVILGGEALTAEHLGALRERAEACVVINEYGPTETVVGCAIHSFLPREAEGPIPIGRPIANAHLHVLDLQLSPCPVGVAGELYIAGAGLARGYLGRPSLTAERFLPCPFGHPGERMYRTGDVCRWGADGALEFIGRVDAQVKVRGYRVELAEIEGCLATHPQIERCAVALRGEGLEARLVGYLVCVSEMPGAEAMRAYLRETLPDSMIPDVFVELAELPLTRNGKLDRAALPTPGSARPRLASQFAAPETPIQAQLARIFCGVLKLDAIGVHDSFFDAGGHSLLATQVVARIRDELAVELSLTELFAHPTIAGLELALAEAGAAAAATEAVTPASRDGELELSFAEQRLWFLNQMRPDSPWYNVAGAMRFRGELDVGALGRAFDAVVARHESLRTNYAATGGRPRRVVRPHAPRALPQVELGDEPLEAYIARRLTRPFDLSREPLLRVALLRLEPGHHLLLLNLHHIVSDGWSMGVLWRELSELYRAEVEGRAPELAPLPIQYADFAIWQRRTMSTLLDEQRRYWARRLTGLPPLILPTARPRPPVQSFRGGTVARPMDPSLRGRLLALGRAQDATLFMTILAAWAVLLARYSGQRDFAIGTAIANRKRVELEGLIGFFVNTLVLRMNTEGDPEFPRLLADVRRTTLEAYEHQDLPFERLVDELGIERDLSRMPLVQVMFVLQNAPDEGPSLPGLDIGVEPISTGTCKFDLILYGHERGDQLDTEIEFNADIFDEPTARRMLDELHTLLAAIVAEPRRSVSRLPLLPERERQQLIEWAGGPTPALASVTRCVHELFIERARSAPERVALTCGDEHVHYGELERRARRVAIALQGRGIGPGDFVGLLGERDPAVVVGLLGILMAGAAYVPLDPHYPRERVRYMAEDASLRALLVAPSLRDAAPAGVEQIELRGELWADRFDEATLAPSGVRPEHAAYVIYTSGSTGRPKGVVVEHRNVLRLFTTAGAQVPLDAEQVWSLFHSIAFDFSVWELWGALLFGGRVVLVPHVVSRSPRQFRELVAREGVTVMSQTPTAFTSFMRADLEASGLPPHRLRVVVFGGETLEPANLRRWCEAQGPRCPVMLNMYGITETTVHVTQIAVDPDQREAPGSPIGRGLADVAVHVLDAHLEPTPIGVNGEVYVGGLGVSRGYLRRPGLTAERFVPDPFGPPGARLYRTGDIACWSSDGQLRYFGRADHQIQLRGFRIELGEIEAALAEHAAVESAIVVPRSDDDGQLRLAAYAVPAASYKLERDDEDWDGERVSHWQSVYDDNYEQGGEDLEFDITGWTDSYTGQALPAAHMRFWLDQTVARVLALGPRRVLEIGCGTGMILLRVAPEVEQYVGVDISRVVLDRLAGVVRERELDNVVLRHGAADALEFAGPRRFDLLIANSVVQYFPGVEYLARMIGSATEQLDLGGKLFLGDLRNLASLEAFHAGVEFARAGDQESRESLRRRVAAQRSDDEELVLDPIVFAALARTIERVAAVEVQLKRGHDDNELTRHRYDVTVHLDAAPPLAVPKRLTGISSEEALAEALARTSADAVELIDVPNPRMQREAALCTWLASGGGAGNVGEMRAALAGIEPWPLGPEALAVLAESLGWRAAVTWSPTRFDSFDAVLVRAGSPLQPGTLTRLSRRRDVSRDLSEYANDPLRCRRSRALAHELRRSLEARLPGYMIPSSFTVLAAVPTTPSGKVDRAALPDPDGLRPELEVGYVAPRTPVEQLVCGVWSEVLGIAKVGIEDDFFDLGG